MSEFGGGGSEKVVITQQDEDILVLFRSLISEEDVALPVAAMNALVLKMKKSKATTWMQLEQELRTSVSVLKNCNDLGGRTNISLGSGCDLFMKYVTRAFSLELVEFNVCKGELLRRAEKFANMSRCARSQIAEFGHSFIQDGCTVLVHGISRVVNTLLIKAAQSIQFNLIITEGRPDSVKFEQLKPFLDANIPTKVITDSAVGVIMEEVDLCLVGAEGVMENGGIVNKIGTYQLALVAEALKKPFYVAVESYKFARMYPLSQKDTLQFIHAASSSSSSSSTAPSSNSTAGVHNGMFTPSKTRDMLGCPSDDMDTFSQEHLTIELPTIDFTPAKFITLLFTDLGVLTPAAVSDELIRLYQ